MRTALLHAAAFVMIAATPAVAQRAARPHLPSTPQSVSTSVDNRWLPSRAVEPRDVWLGSPQRTSPAIDKSRGGLFNLGPGDSVGYTYYDLQTNSAMTDRIINWPNEAKPLGSINATMVWTASTDQPAPAPSAYDASTRGTYGAIHSEGGWLPMRGSWQRLEDERTGFVDLERMSDGRIVFASHTADRVIVNIELDAGTNEFARVDIPGSDRGLWASIAVNENDDIHLIWTYTTGDVNEDEVFYSRSTDKGNSFSDAVALSGPNSVIGTAIRSGFGANSYTIAARGGNVAVWFLTSSIELMQLRSNDRGETWPSETAVFLYNPTNTRRYQANDNPDSLIWPDPSFGSDTAVGFRTDTVPAPGSSLDMMLDDDGYTHGVFAIFPTYVRRYYPLGGDTTADTYRRGIIYQTTFNYPDVAFLYVRERDNRFISSRIAQPGGLSDGEDPEGYPDYYIRRGYHGGFSMYPQLGMDAARNVYAVFASGIDGDVQQERRRSDSALKSWLNYHVFVTWMRSDDEALRWLAPVDLTPRGLDAKFPSLADLVDDQLHIAYQIDPIVGEFITDTLAPIAREKNNIEVLMMPQSSLADPAGVASDARETGIEVTVSPNPARGNASVQITAPGRVSVRLVDALGRVVRTIVEDEFLSATVRRTIESSALAPGLYYLVTRCGGTASTTKFEVMR